MHALDACGSVGDVSELLQPEFQEAKWRQLTIFTCLPYLTIAGAAGILTTFFLKKTANRPLYGDTLNASNR